MVVGGRGPASGCLPFLPQPMGDVASRSVQSIPPLPAARQEALAWGTPRDTHPLSLRRPENNGSLSPPELVPVLGTVPRGAEAEGERQQRRAAQRASPGEAAPLLGLREAWALLWGRPLGKPVPGWPTRAPDFFLPGHLPFGAFCKLRRCDHAAALGHCSAQAPNVASRCWGQ